MWALLPVKRFEYAKQRLAGVLSSTERCSLSLAMLEDVLAVITHHPGLEGVTVVSDEPQVAKLRRHFLFEWLAESSLQASGLNGVVQAAADVLTRRGIEDLLIIHGDLPMIRKKELSWLLKIHHEKDNPGLTVATDRCGTGSNCVICSPVSGVTFGYGYDSRLWFENQARMLRRVFNVVELTGVACDIDQAEDIRYLLTMERPDYRVRTLDYLECSGIGKRLAPESGANLASPTILSDTG